MTSFRLPPPHQFNFRREAAADGSPIGVVSCARCKLEVGRFSVAQLFGHAQEGKQYVCERCDRVPEATS